MRFVEYVEYRENQKFAEKFELLCREILESGVDFYEYWHEIALPVLNETQAETPEELLVEFDFGRSYLNPKNWFGGNQGRSWSGERKEDPRWAAGMGEMGKQKQDAEDQRKAAIEAARQKRLSQFQQQVDTHLGSIKQKFAQAMRMFLKSASDEALKSGDKAAYMVAQSFYNKIMSVAQPAIDKLAYKAQFTKSNPVGDEFAQRQGAMQRTNQAGVRNRAANRSQPSSMTLPPMGENPAGEHPFRAGDDAYSHTA